MKDFNSERRDSLERVFGDNWSVIRLVVVAGGGVERGVSRDGMGRISRNGSSPDSFCELVCLRGVERRGEEHERERI